MTTDHFEVDPVLKYWLDEAKIEVDTIPDYTGPVKNNAYIDYVAFDDMKHPVEKFKDPGNRKCILFRFERDNHIKEILKIINAYSYRSDKLVDAYNTIDKLIPKTPIRLIIAAFERFAGQHWVCVETHRGTFGNGTYTSLSSDLSVIGIDTSICDQFKEDHALRTLLSGQSPFKLI